MNKYKKIAAAAVSVVMAGTMVASLAGCTNNNDGGKKGTEVMKRFEGFMQDAWKDAVKGYGTTSSAGSNLSSDLTPKVKSGTKELDYAADTELSTAIGYDEKGNTGIKYNSNLIGKLKDYGVATATTATLYGSQYQNSSLKPAWNALQTKLGVTIKDSFDNKKTGEQMQAIKDSPNKFAGYQLFTASAGDINTEGASGNLLNIADYLDYMPNYKAFLDANPIVRLSLTADANGAMYMLPYFDGNDDIEKFVLLRKDFVETMLDGTTAPDGTVTWKAQGQAKGLTTTASYAESYMGKTGNYEIDVTDPSVLTNYEGSKATLWGNDLHKVDDSNKDNLTKTVKVKVNYDAALAAAKDATTGLGKAVSDAAGKAYTGESGNILDLQNYAINETQGEVNGAKLITILREYVKVAYEQGTNKFYVGEGKKLSDVFNSAYAAWDVDLYTALGRCFVTSGTMLGSDNVKSTADMFLLTGREYKSNRFTDTSALAGELYGVRGLESRYQYTYIKSDGTLTDARSHTETYEAVNKMYALTQEGLYNPMVKNNITNGYSSLNVDENKGVQVLSLHDYVQTQTKEGGFAAELAEGADPYNFAPVLTPVSKWDTDDDGVKDTTMRFTESWRGVKNTGWCISKDGVKGNADKLSASLALVDYFFSNDGQILMTYGPQSTSGNDNGSVDAAKAEGGGFWYGNEVTNYPAEALETIGGQKVVKEAYKHLYFTFNDKVYTGEYYNGRQIPVLTDSSKAMFNVKTLGDHNFTNYARYYIGSALNIGNKDQGFEYQCTAKCGLAGSQIVNIALVNGTVKHPTQVVPAEVGTKNDTNWYTLAPSLLPYTKRANDAISIAPYNLVTGVGQSNNLFASENSATPNLIIDIMAYGLGSGAQIRVMSDGSKIPDTAQGVIDYLNNL